MSKCKTNDPASAQLKSFSETNSSSETVRDSVDFTFIDLFAGIGGLRYGFESINGRCVYTSEWDKFCQQTYRANFPLDKHDISGDISRISEDAIPNHNVLLAGFPCQPFSIAGVSKRNSLNKAHGFACEVQGTLIFDIARIVKARQPQAIVLENVKNLLSHNKGRTFTVIRRLFEDGLGYSLSYRVINARSWLPQKRERLFIVGFKNDVGFDFGNFEIPNPNNGPKLSQILHSENGNEVAEDPYTVGRLGVVSDKYVLSDHLWQYLQDYAERHRKKGNGFGYGLVSPNHIARTLSARYYKDGSEILVERSSGRPRRLTPRECARLMGFDSPNESLFKIPVSDTQAYKQFGNSVAVPVVRAVANFMKPYLQRSVS